MTQTQKIVAVLALIVLSVLAFIVYRSESQRGADMATLKATLQQQGEIIKALGAHTVATDQQAAAGKTAVDKQVSGAVTPQQMATLISSLAGLRTPAVIQASPSPASTNSTGAATPAATVANDLIVPSASIPDLLKFAGDCKKAQIDSAACSSDLLDSRLETQAVVKERDAAITAVKGGGLWTRVKRNAKMVGFGGALGIAVGLAARR